MHVITLEDDDRPGNDRRRAAKDKAIAELTASFEKAKRKRTPGPAGPTPEPDTSGPRKVESPGPSTSGGGVVEGNAANVVNGGTGGINENVTMDFEDENGTDGAKALEKVDSVKVTWDKDDLKFFFVEIEDAMELVQIKSQWLKKQVLSRALPPAVKSEVKDILIQRKSEAGTDIYKRLKLWLMELFGPRESDAYDEAASLVLTGKPSALCKRMIVLLCESKKPLEGCCCAKTIAALWKKQLPPVVRAAVAGMSLATNLDDVLKKADDVYASQGNHASVAAVSELDETLPALQSAGVAAVSAAKKQQQKNRGHPHPDGPPETACYLHWKHGKSAYTCKKKSTCPWKSFTKPRPKNND